MRIGIITHAEWHLDPHILITVGPVHDLLADQLFVRDQMFTPVAGDHGRVPGVQLVDPTERVAKRDHVSGLYGFVQQK